MFQIKSMKLQQGILCLEQFHHRIETFSKGKEILPNNKQTLSFLLQLK